MPLIYRAMLTDVDGKPLVGASGKMLGVRLPPDPHADISVEKNGTVQPRTGGMSVVPAWRDLPLHLIPKRLKPIFPRASGANQLSLWKLGNGDFQDGPVSSDLALRIDPARPNGHGFVEPSNAMQITDFLAALAGTRKHWLIDET